MLCYDDAVAGVASLFVLTGSLGRICGAPKNRDVCYDTGSTCLAIRFLNDGAF